MDKLVESILQASANFNDKEKDIHGYVFVDEIIDIKLAINH